MTAPETQFLDDAIAHWSATTPDGECMTYLERSWTWAQWHDRVRRNAGGLSALGVGRGDRVAFLDKNHPACVETTIAASMLGAANAIINFRLAGDEIDYAVNDSGAKVLIVGAELMPQIEAIKDRLTNVSTIIEVTPDGAEGDQYEAFLNNAEPRDRDAEVTPEDPAYVMYSSGTTGRPKGVLLSHANMLAHTRNALTFEFDPGDKVMVSMPLFHVGGSSYIQFPLNHGVPSVMTREVEAAALAGAIMQGANRTFLVPAVLAQVLASGGDAVKLFGALKTYVYGAAPMPLPLLQAAIEAWPDTDFMQVYGLTEVCGVATVLDADAHRDQQHPERLVSAGKPVEECEIKIVAPDSAAEVATNEPGEIWMRTPQLMSGYLNKPEATAGAITDDGWFRTGDIGRIDADGFVFVEDRLKDMIISGGENIYSPEVEGALSAHPAVAEVAVIGIPDDNWGETVKAVVALKPGENVTEQEIISFCREHIAAFKCPKTVDFVEALPRNPTGKILKRDLRQPYWEGRSKQV